MKSETVMKNSVWVVILAVICNVLWGSAFPFIKIGYEAFQITTKVSDKILFAGARFTISGLLLFIVYFIWNKSVPKLKKENIYTVGLLAFFQTTAQYIFFYIGLSHTTAANGSIVNSMNVFISAIVAHFVYANDKMNVRKGTGCILGFLGVLLVTLGQGKMAFAWNGEGFIIISGVMFAIGSVLSKKATKLDDSVAITAWNLFAGGVVLLVLGFITGGSFQRVNQKGIIVLLYLACLSAIAFALWTLLLKYNSMSKISIYNFVIPVAGTLLSGVMLGESIMEPRYGISLVLVTVGICIVNVKKETKK